jgi:hypothetical protein
MMKKSIRGLIIPIAAVMMSALFASSGVALASRQTMHEHELRGEVVAVDNLHHINMLTLESTKIGQYPNDQLNIFMNKNTSVKVCNEREPEHDIRVSSNATIRYHEVQGLLPLADSVTERC